MLKIFGAVLATAVAVGSADARELRKGPPPVVAATESSWVGYAASSNGRVFKIEDASREAVARIEARKECESTTQRTCRAIAVTDGTEVIALRCRDGGRSDTFLGGSNQGGARYIAEEKAREEGFGARQCSEVYRE